MYDCSQFVIAKACAIKTLLALNIEGADRTPLSQKITSILQDLFKSHGDRIAQQYGGSGAMHKEALRGDDTEEEGTKKREKGSKLSNALTAVRRYYSNNYSDHDKQLSYDLLLSGGDSSFMPDSIHGARFPRKFCRASLLFKRKKNHRFNSFFFERYQTTSLTSFTEVLH